MSSNNGPAAGTAFHPQADPVFNGASRPGNTGQLARLPRQRRPAMLALSIVLVGVGILASTYIYAATDRQETVLVVTADVPSGAVITQGAVGTARVSAGPGVQVIPASQLQQVVGEVAGSALHPGMLLTASELATSLPPSAGQDLVPVPVKPSLLPASGLAAGDRVLVVATPGAGSGGAPAVLIVPVAGVVEAVSSGPDSDGFDVVDLLVASANAIAVTKQVSTGQFALIITRRSR